MSSPAAPQQVVFIDSSVPDLQDLLGGLAPGVEAFVVDPSSDGLAQIASILAANDLTDLSSISIVGHGAPGQIQIGSTTLDEADLANERAALSQIGTALAPGGGLQLYACDVAAGPAGQQFIADLSSFAAAPVAAASTAIGETPAGENWTLDVTSGPSGASTAAAAPIADPFTANAEAQFSGTLGATAPDPELWISGTTGVNENLIIHADDTGTGTASNTGTLFTPDSVNQPVASNLSGLDLLQLDTQDNVFVVSSMDSGDPSDIYVVSLSTALSNPTGNPTFTKVFEDTSNSGSGYVISGLALDPDHSEIYFVDHDSFEKVSYSGTGLTTLASTTADGVLPLDGLALDLPHSVAYFATDETTTTSIIVGGVTEFPTVLSGNSIYKTSSLTNASSSVTISKLVDVPDADGVVANGTGVQGIAVDTATGLIYFTTQKVSYVSGGHLVTSNSGVYAYNPTGGTVNGIASGAFKTIWQQGSGGGPTGDLESIQVDVATGKYYVTVHPHNGDPAADDAVYVGSLSANGTTAPTLFLQIPSYTHGGQPLADGFSLDNAPTFASVTGAGNYALQGGAAVLTLSADGADADTDNDKGDGAQIVITNPQSGDLLEISGAQSGTLDGGKISYSYNSSTHTMTLFGTDSFAEYQTVIDAIQFQDTGTDNSTGSHPTRTITYQVYDGLLYSAVSGSTTITQLINRAPTLGADNYSVLEANSASGTSGTGGTGVLGNDSDKDGDSIFVTALNGSAGNVGTSIAGTYGHLTLNSNGSFTYNADLTSAIDAAANGSHPVDSFNYTVSDGLNGVTTQTVSFTIDRPPTAAADSYTVAESSPVSGTSGTGGTGVLHNDSDKDGDTLTVSQVNGSAGSVGNSVAGTYGHLTLNSNGSFTYTADITSAIDGAATGSRSVDTFNYTISDGQGGTSTANVGFTIDRPVVVDLNGAAAGNNATASFTEQTPLVIAPSATISSPDTLTLTSLTATLVARPDGNAVESLSLNSAAAILAANDTLSVGYTASTGVLSITGTASTADYQSILDGIVYNDTSDDPNTTDRTVNVVGTNSASETNTTSSVDISVTRVNDPPVNHVPGTQIFNEDTSRVFNSANGNLISISDPDVESGNETVALSVSHGNLTLGTTSNIVINSGANNSSSVTFTGTLANVNTALNGLTYAPASNFNGSDTLTITTNDNGNTPGPAMQDQNTVTLAVSAVNDAPVVVNGSSVALVAIDEDSSPPGVTINSLLSNHFSDAADDQTANGGSAANNFAGVAVTADAATAGQGVWQYSTDGGAHWTPFPSVTTASALLIAATDEIEFLPALNFNGTPGSLTVHLVDNSGGAITTGGTANLTTTGGSTPYSSGAITIGESVNAVNDAPTFTGLGGTASFTEGTGLGVTGTAVTLALGATVHDVELDALNSGNGNYAGATLTLVRDGGASADDLFGFSSGTFTVNGSALQSAGQTFATFTSTGGTLTISFTSSGTIATTALVNNVLDHITYANTSDAPPSSVQVDYTFNDGNSGSQGSGGALTGSGHVTVSITPTNDAPDVTPNSPSAVTYIAGQAGPVELLSTGTVTDPDQPANFAGGDLTVAITAGDDAAHDQIVLLGSSPFTDNGGTLMDGATAIGTIAGLDSDSVSVTALTTAATPAEIGKLLEAFGFQTTSTDTTDRTITFTFDDGGNTGGTPPGLSDSVSQTVHVTQPTTGQLYYVIDNGPDDQAGRINSDGSHPTEIYASTGNNQTSIAVDTAAGLVFAVDASSNVTVHALSNGSSLATLALPAAQAIALDPYTQTIYVGVRGADTDHTGIEKLTYDPATGVLTDHGFLFTATDTETTPGDATTSQFTNAVALYFDHANSLLYYADDDAGLATAPFQPTNGIYVVSTAGPTFAPVELTDPTQFPAAATPGGVGSAGNIVGLAVDVADGIVFFETSDPVNAANNTLWWVSASGGAGQTATEIVLPAGVTLNYAGDAGAGGIAAGLTFDPATQNLYLTNAYQDGTTHDAGAIYALKWDSGSQTVSLAGTFDTATLAGQPAGTVSALDAPSATAFDDLPTLTLTATATPATEGGAAVTLLTAESSSDNDGDHYAGATVQITGGTFSSNETSTLDDLLSLPVNGGNLVLVDGGATTTTITATYDSATETLTLSGYDTVTNYDKALAEIQYTASGSNPTNYGLDATRTLQWTVSDGAPDMPFGESNSGTTFITIDAVNNAPANTVPGPQTVAEDTALSISGVSVSDPDNQSLTVTLSAAHGTVTLGSVTNLTASGNGSDSVTISGAIADLNSALASLSYQGDANFNSTTADTLTVSTSDGIAAPTVSTVDITVTAVDDAPSGADHAASTPVNTAYVFQVGDFGFSDAADDQTAVGGSSPNNFAAVKITTLTLPPGATLQDNGADVAAGQFIPVADINSGLLVFTPANSAGGANYASFTFQVEDDGTGANLDPTPNVMTLNVGSNFGPTAAADSYNVLESATLNKTAGTGGTGVLHNDSGNSLAVTAVNGSAGNVNNSTPGTYGELTLNDDGSFSYAADQTAAIDGTSSGAHPFDTFNYTVTDSSSNSATTTVTFSIDRAPTVTTHTVGILETASTGTVSANDTDPDGDTLTVTALTGGTVGAPLAGSYGTLTINANDTYSYTANNTTAIDAAAPGSHPVDTFTYTVDDGLGGLTQETLAFSIDRAPAAPVDNDPANDSGPVKGSIAEGSAAGTTVGITAFSSDADGDTATYSLTDSAGGFFKIDAATGVVSVDTAGATGIDYESATGHAYSITVQADDGHGGLSSQSFTIAVTDVAPSAPVDSDTVDADTVVEGAAAGTAVGITASSSDVNGGTVSYSLTNDANGAFTIDPTSGVVTVADPTKIDFETTAPNHTLSITVQASTTNGTAVSTADFTIAVTDANPSTPIDADPTADGVTEGAAAGTFVGITASSSDVNGPPVIYTLTDSAGGFFTIDSGTGVVSVDTAGATGINYETASGHAYSITVQASDGQGGVSTQTFSIPVTDVAPTSVADSYTVDEDTLLNPNAAAGVIANDTDINGGPLTAVLDTPPTHDSTFTLNPDGSFSYQGALNFNGSDSFTYHAFDGAQSGGTVTVNLTINPVNDVPILTGFGDTSSFTENGSSVVLDVDGNAAVSDVELDAAGNYAGATLTIARQGGANSDDSFVATGSLDVVDVGVDGNVSLDGGMTFIGAFIDNGDGSVTFTFNSNATSADVDSVMRQIAYADASDNPPATVNVDFTFSDGNGVPGGQNQGGGASPGIAVGTFTVDVTQVDDPPALLNVAVAASYPIGSTGVDLSSGLQAFDPDAAPPSPIALASATITITSGFLASDELFVNLPTDGSGHFITPDTGITDIVVQSNSGGQLVLTGSGEPSQPALNVLAYQEVLEAVSYRSSSADPTNGGTDPTRIISWQLSDGVLDNEAPVPPNPPGTYPETTLGFNQPPSIDLDGSTGGTGYVTTYTENGAPLAIVASSVSITDPDDAAIAQATIILTDAKADDALFIAGSLPVGIDSLIDTSVAGQITLTLFGSAALADYQTALQQIQFVNTSENPDPTDREITVQVSNTGSSNVAHATVHVISVNDAPVATIGPASYTAIVQTSLSLKNVGLSVSDADDGGGTETITLSVGEGTLTVAAGTSGAVIDSGNGSGSVTFHGTIAQLDDLLNTNATSAITYIDDTVTPGPATTLTLAIDDNGNTGTGGALTGQASATITIDRPPTISGTVANQSTLAEAPVQPFSGVTIGDPNAGATDTLTITLSSNGAKLGTLSGSGLTGSGAAYQLAGTAAAITTELDALTYTPVNGVPATSVTTTFALSDRSSTFPTPTTDNSTSVIDTDLTNPSPPPGINFPHVAPSNVDEWILVDGEWAASAQPGSIPSGYQVAGIGDFTGNGASDILWQNPATGDTQEWLINNGAWAGTVDLGGHPGNFQIAGVGHFFGNGIDDVLWTNPNGPNGDTQVDIWELGSNGQWIASVTPGLGLHPPGYHVVAVGDFTGNGTSDILWQNPTTGDVDEWQIANGQWAKSVDLGSHPGTDWTIAGVGDFFGNGRDDILWTNAGSGPNGDTEVDIWQLGSGGQWTASVTPGLGLHPPGYQVAAIGNFTGNGTDGVLWYDPTNGNVDEWVLNNNGSGQWAASINLGSHPGNFQIAGTGSFVNGNSTSDILWHSNT